VTSPKSGESVDIKGTVALLTGSDRGVGGSFVEALVERGAATPVLENQQSSPT
jgi:NAD(P)-dependent dehydrogenase (short-subunit alcohol dehydrogenase family)